MFFCFLCPPPAFFKKKCNLERHITTMHQHLRPFECTICGLKFPSRFNFLRHERKHKNESGRFRCHLCPDHGEAQKSFHTKFNLMRHLRGYHRERSEKWCKKQEERITQLLEKNNITFLRELPIPFQGCIPEKLCTNKHYARLDFCVHNNNYPEWCTIVSVDEHEHRTYGDEAEISRILNVLSSIQLRAEQDPFYQERPKRIRWIRYNPDAYRRNGKRPRRYATSEEREAILLQLLQSDPKNCEAQLELIYLFYSTDQSGAISLETAMPDGLRQCISARIN